MDGVIENVIEWLRGDKEAKVTAPTASKLKGQVMRLAEKYPDEVRIIDENRDGSIYASVPVKWVNIRHPRILSDKQIEAAKERLERIRKDKE